MAAAALSPAGRLLYSLLTGDTDDVRYNENQLLDFAAIASALATRLAARAFAGPADGRIEPFAQQAAQRCPAATSLAPLIRAALGGWDHLEQIPKEEVPGLCLLLIATLLIDADGTRDDLARLIVEIDGAE